MRDPIDAAERKHADEFDFCDDEQDDDFCDMLEGIQDGRYEEMANGL